MQFDILEDSRNLMLRNDMLHALERHPRRCIRSSVHGLYCCHD
jgi:hypothetical protein